MLVPRAKRAKRGRPPGRERSSDPAVTLVKKYGNRRLYDTRRSRYVTLEELCEVIATGEEIRVVDAKNGEDLTKRVVTKIIFLEEERRSIELLPLAFLRKLIEHREDSMREFYQRYLALSLELYRSSQQQMKDLMPPSLTVPPGAAPGLPAGALPEPSELDEIADIKARIASLEARALAKKI